MAEQEEMNIGIVGCGFDKFTSETRELAYKLIRELLSVEGAVLVSGRSPVGGIDVMAEETADALYILKIIHAPKVEQWDPPFQYGYKARNLDIAKDSDVVHVIAVKEYPPGYRGQRFDLCYHCARAGRDSRGHKKSGACWTLNAASVEIGKRQKMGAIHIISEEGITSEVYSLDCPFCGADLEVETHYANCRTTVQAL